MMMMMMMLMKMIMMIITPAGIPGNNDDEIQGYHFVVGNEDDGWCFCTFIKLYILVS